MARETPSEPELPLDLPATAAASSSRRPRGGERWDDVHQRVTFYCPKDVLRALGIEAARSRRSKTQVIVDALAEHLRSP